MRRAQGEFHRRGFLAAGAAGLVLPLAGFRGFGDKAAPKAELWERWRANDPASGQEPDYAGLDELLAAHLRDPADDPLGLARFDYAGASAAERGRLEEFNRALAGLEVSSFAPLVQFAYWCNLYNALTLEVVLKHWPVESIRDIDISPGFFASGPWDAPLAEVEGEALTLNDVEHRILRPVWGDARAHYAVNCASVGCPNLRASAWRAEGLEGALDEAGRAFVNSPRGVMLDGAGRIVVSKIYSWFISDFGGDEAGVLAHLARYAEGETAGWLSDIADLHASAYDWAVNAA